MDKLKEDILWRGRKWTELKGIKHMQFDGIAASRSDDRRILRHKVGFHLFHFLRITIDSHLCDNDSVDEAELTNKELLLTLTVISDFSLCDKLWLQFDVDRVFHIEWNKDAFANLVLPMDRKDLLQSLVEAHHHELRFDDFIKDKGHGLVINLFGPPGVGKTFSAEATSEHVKRPLYLVGAGDLGTDTKSLDMALKHMFQVATMWKAIVLIDKADVFLERLHHVEYYCGILFLTMNHVKAFDEAFFSCIHISLHFPKLPEESRAQVWSSFIAKVDVEGVITPEEIKCLTCRDINGRQIKNAVRTAQSLALGHRELLSLRHFLGTLDAMEDFTKEFEGKTL
ncbi:P-loop containing nucleoside triphosphate hydrolase protein [Desarmillaria ectypa]|nr:P-loop containing nucleoside triphosphate hydrolase protein [Desarmillaria ectypa]